MTDQLTRDQFTALTAEQKVRAHHEGRLNTLLGIAHTDSDLIARALDPTRSVTRDDIRRLEHIGRHDLIAELTIDRITENTNV